MTSFQATVSLLFAIIAGVQYAQGAGTSLRGLQECVNDEGKLLVQGFKLPRSCVALANKNACSNDLIPAGSGKVFNKCPQACGACDGPIPTPAPIEIPVGCEDSSGKFEVTGLKNPRSCVALANLKYCKNELVDGSSKVFQICPVSCEACNGFPTSAPAPDDCVDAEGKFAVDGFRNPRSCVALANNNGCLRVLSDGSGKVFEKCPRACDACTVKPKICNDAEGKFLAVGFRNPRSCFALANNEGCDKELADGSGKVSEKCPVSCKGDCTDSPTMSPSENLSAAPSDPPSNARTGSPTASPSEAPTDTVSEAPSEATSASLSPSSTAADTPDKTVEGTAGETSEERLLSFQAEEGRKTAGGRLLEKLRKPFK